MEVKEPVLPTADLDNFLKVASQTNLKYASKRILVSNAKGFELVSMKDILYIEVFHRILMVHYKKNKWFLMNGSLNKIEKPLRRLDFIRIHRRFIISMHRVKTITYKEMTLDNGKTIPIGKTYQKTIRKEVQQKCILRGTKPQ